MTDSGPSVPGVTRGELAIIGAGFGRTGTYSLKLALEKLGFGPTHHMVECFRLPQQFDLWLDVLAGHPNWNAVFGEFSSCVDFPACVFYKELAARYPKALVLLSVRDTADAWYQSVQDTIFHDEIHGAPWITRLMSAVLPYSRKWCKFKTRLLEAQFGSMEVFKNEESLKRMYLEHIEEVKRIVPADRLLVYNVKQGWAPLCAFLKVPVPNEPFPRANDTAQWQERNNRRRATATRVLLFAALTVGAACWAAWKFRLFPRLLKKPGNPGFSPVC